MDQGLPILGFFLGLFCIPESLSLEVLHIEQVRCFGAVGNHIWSALGFKAQNEAQSYLHAAGASSASRAQTACHAAQRKHFYLLKTLLVLFPGVSSLRPTQREKRERNGE